MTYKKFTYGASLSIMLVLLGCGGGGSDTSVADSGSSDTGASTGYFVDSAVVNADYDCVADNDYNKTTDSEGAFHCKDMSRVRFRLGKLLLGEIHTLPVDGYVLPQTLVGVPSGEINDSRVIELARLLQSLDSDGNLTNGIQISDEVKDAMPDGEFITMDDAETVVDQLENSLTIHMRTKEEARDHLRATLQSIHSDDLNNDAPSAATLTQEARDAIAYMGNEERLAHDVYMALYNYWMEKGEDINQLVNIAQNSETRHIEAVQGLVRKYNLTPNQLSNVDEPVADMNISIDQMPNGKYDVAEVQALYDRLYAKGVDSPQDALEVGCMVEVTDINDLNKDIAIAEASEADDVVETFNFLKSGSYNHYWAFDKGLKNMGIDEGCCSLGTQWCHPEYPQNGNGRNGNGRDKGKRIN